MAGVSTESLRKLSQLFEQRFSTEANSSMSDELFAVADVLDHNGALRRGLTDPSREAEQRGKVASSVLEGKVYPAVREIVARAAESRWSAERDLADAVEHLGVLAAAFSAENSAGEDALSTVVDDLLRFSKTVQSDPQLQTALTDQRADVEAKKTLASRVSPAASDEGRLLIAQAVEHPRGMLPADLAEKFANVLVGMSQRFIAKVTVGAPLTDEHRQRLLRAVSGIYGRDMTLDVTVAPEVLGGIKVQVGDEVIDGTVASRVADLDRSVHSS
ncbi:F0F1 ATP synthase subunit delta [Curtobacterium sp. S6]|uniref:F0F1 ATP synthase subunit delta n=1 Tax=Curtobacterium sp. S6 TaxID=1479623 RepID=UPI0004AA6ADA|nr:F0F1 ATP synthase subunit delta [Curtobacterium sp. S6]